MQPSQYLEYTTSCVIEKGKAKRGWCGFWVQASLNTLMDMSLGKFRLSLGTLRRCPWPHSVLRAFDIGQCPGCIKLISVPYREFLINWSPRKLPFLAWRTLTHYILMSVIFRSHLTPPICLKMPICAIFSTFRESHFEHTPKVRVRCKKFNIGNVAQIFFGDFYIC